MAGWRVVSFDRAAGRGICTSGVGTVAFDASVAIVDDFVVGEEVDVTLRPLASAQGGYEVLRIAPTSFRPPFAASRIAAQTAEIDRWIAELVGRRVTLARVEDGDVLLEVEDDTYQPRRALVFASASMIQMPMEIDALAILHAFASRDVAQAAPELVRHWPPLADEDVVFRLDPERFGQAPAYVVARAVRLARL